MKTSMKQSTEGAMRFKQNIHLNSCLPIVSILLITLLLIPIAGNAGPLATIVITSVPALGTPPTIAVGQSVVFTAEGKDAQGNTVPIPDPGWYSDGTHGTIVVDPTDPNKCTYTATNEGAGYIQCCDGPPGTGKHGSDDFNIAPAGPPCTFDCGDGVCCKAAGEDIFTCLQDCGSCGDGVCCAAAGEDIFTCYQDCGFCGDGVCCAAAGEDKDTCRQDCGSCGDGVCCEEAGEDKDTCYQDCGWCGDGVCCAAAGEDKDTCRQDCGSCGDGVCCAAAGEGIFTCCQDCGSCGDGECCEEAGEDMFTCPQDCGFCGDGVCRAEAGEGIFTCCQDCGSCGDGECCEEAGEDMFTCPQDCCSGEWGEDLYNKGVGEDISTYGDGISDAEEDGAPNGGGGNGDGILDSLQSNVGSIPSATGTGYLTVEVISGCRHLEKIRTYTEAAQGNDNDYDYPYGLVGFELPCSSATIRVYFHGESDLSGYTYRKYGPIPPNFNNPQWYTLPGVTFGTVDIGGQTVAYAEFTLTDGQLGDDTGVDGVIYDPGGPGISMPHDLLGFGDGVLSFDFFW